MRIGLVAHHVGPIAPPFVGGVESFTFYLARWLARRGHDVTLFAPAGSAVPGVTLRLLELRARLSIQARADVSMPPQAFMDAHYAYQSLMTDLALRGSPFDVVHLHSLHYLPVAMAPLVASPVLLTLHTPPTPWLETALRTPRPGVDDVVAVSRVAARLWADALGPVDVISNGIDLDTWRPGPGGERAVWSGRVVAEKAPHLAIDAARRAGMRLDLAGPLLDGDYFAAEVEPRLGGGVRYLGHLGHDELRRLVGASRVAVVSSVWEEPFGLVAVEAMAAGTPVAAFASGALAEVVGDRAGRLASTADVDDLARAIRVACELDRGGVRHAARGFDIDEMGAHYEHRYRVLAHAPGRHERLGLVRA